MQRPPSHALSLVLSLVLPGVALSGCGAAPPRVAVPDAEPSGSPAEMSASAASTAEQPPPTGQLPEDVEPSHYDIELGIMPDEEGFSGRTRIQVTLRRAMQVIWLHGNGLVVGRATVTPEGGAAVAARYKQVDDQGVASLTLEQPLGPGAAVIEIEYSAPFNRSLTGLYRVDEGGDSYAFTQFEATSARRAFPGFDEPRFKVTHDVTLTVRREHRALANTPELGVEELPEGLRRVRFATTRPMPTYLLAWAVGPLDVVEHAPVPASEVRAEPLPLRGVAVRGRGARLAYALENTAPLLQWLESYFGIPYPYAKLDIVAVPDFAAGAMENVGLVTFRETLLLLDAKAPERQKRRYAGVMAHELAHMWFGNYVTMPWWDDIWLNEAFATWMGHKAVHAVHPEHQAQLGLLGSVHRAMSSDSLVSARQIRQPIESNHDIRNAFDGITYRKGGGVLSMIERWLGEETFREGMRRYMSRHAWGSATANDLMTDLSAVAGRDVGAPFRSFIEQPGLPFVEVARSCEGEQPALSLRQSRYLPVGSTGERARGWKIPMCVRYGVGDQVFEGCTLLEEPVGELALEGGRCPDWVMPNARGAGYYRFSLAGDALKDLRGAGWARLTPMEKLAFADSLRAAFESGSLPAAELYASLQPLAQDRVRQVAMAPMALLEFALERLVGEEQRSAVRALARRLYMPTYRRLGWEPSVKGQEDGESTLLRAAVLEHLALVVEDRRVRRAAVRHAHAYLGHGWRGDGAMHPESLDANLRATALAVAIQEGDAAFFEKVLALLFATDDATLREHLLAALGAVRAPALALRARQLALDPRLRINEMNRPLWGQLRMSETRTDAWEWLLASYDQLVERIGPFRAGYLPYMGRFFCDPEGAAAVDAFFSAEVPAGGSEGGSAGRSLARIQTLPGGPRNLASVLEGVRLCAARVEAQRESAREFFLR